MTDTRPTRASSEGRAYLDLQNLARRTRRNTLDLLRMYALEGFLARLAASTYASRLVLKGGVLLAAYDARRPTRDVDLQAQRLSGDIDDVVAMVSEIAETPAGDGLVFDVASASGSTIREEDSYSGTRVRLGVRLASAQMVIHVDVNVGDPIWPPPQRIVMPGLLDRRIELVGYPLPMMYAEKIVTMIDRGRVNTRWRDFADVYVLSGRHTVRSNELHTSLHRVAEYRSVELVSLAKTLDGFAEAAQPRWTTWRRKQQLADAVPDDFAQALVAVMALADPVLAGEITDGTWQPLNRAWGR